MIPSDPAPVILSDQFTFTVYMEPCLVSTYQPTAQVEEIIYNIGQPELTSGFYSFAEDPICNYEQTTTVSSVPAFITHNEATSDFTIAQTNDLALMGGYTLSINSAIQVPTDHTKTDF